MERDQALFNFLQVAEGHELFVLPAKGLGRNPGDGGVFPVPEAQIPRLSAYSRKI